MESLSTALISLLVAVVLALVEKIRRDLGENTTITKQTKEAANGTLHKTMERLKEEQERAERLQDLVRDQQDKLSFLSAKLPEVQEILSSYRDRRRDEIPPCMRRS